MVHILGTNIPFFSIYNLKKFFGHNKETQAYNILLKESKIFIPEGVFNFGIWDPRSIFQDNPPLFSTTW